jgi:hypothetical protein
LILALDKDDGSLLAFASADEVAARCKGVDVQDGFWRFYADDGSPLEARFEIPSESQSAAGLPGAYTLQRAMSGLWLQERLHEVKTVKGCGLASVADLVEMLKVNRGKRVAAQLKR